VRAPDGIADEQILMLADILPTGYEVTRAKQLPRRRCKPGQISDFVTYGPSQCHDAVMRFTGWLRLAGVAVWGIAAVAVALWLML